MDSGWRRILSASLPQWKSSSTLLFSGLLPREPPAGSGPEAHHPPAAHTLGHPLQVQQGWVQDEGAGAYTVSTYLWMLCISGSFSFNSLKKGRFEWNKMLVDVIIVKSVIVSGVSPSGDHAELNNWAPLLHRPLPTDPGTRRNTGLLPWEVDLSPHCTYTVHTTLVVSMEITTLWARFIQYNSIYFV